MNGQDDVHKGQSQGAEMRNKLSPIIPLTIAPYLLAAAPFNALFPFSGLVTSSITMGESSSPGTPHYDVYTPARARPTRIFCCRRCKRLESALAESLIYPGFS